MTLLIVFEVKENYFCGVKMKSFSIYILSFIILIASFQNSLLFLDYNINRNFYETHCVNKDKPEMNCHGKCEIKKESEKPTSPFNLVKIGFEFNILPNQEIEIPKPKILWCNLQSNSNITSTFNISEGYLHILPKPPQI